MWLPGISTSMTMMVSRIITMYYYVNRLLISGPYFVEDNIIVDEDVGIVELCINYTSRDDLPQSLNVSLSLKYPHGTS